MLGEDGIVRRRETLMSCLDNLAAPQLAPTKVCVELL
jgi:hypothetical protein